MQRRRVRLEISVNTNDDGHTNGRNRDPLADLDDEYEDQIVPGQGKIESMTFATNQPIEQAVRDILGAIGENPDREGLLRTPMRVAKMYAEMTAGYSIDPQALIN